MKSITIDTDKQPNIPKGWTIESYTKGGKLKWNPETIELYLSEKQKTGSITGNDLRKELENKPVLNACVLDYLLKHPDLIPEAWKGKYVYFWGTIFRDAVGDLCVGYLYWGDGRWRWFYDWLDCVWRDRSPAASLASIPRNSDPQTLGSPLALEPSDDLRFQHLAARMEKLEEKMSKIGKILSE